MDLISKYYADKGYDYELNKKYESKHRKIVSWQKKYRSKTNVPSTARKFSKLRLRISKSSIFRDRCSIASDLETQNDFSKMFNNEIMKFNSKSVNQICCWREPDATQLHVTASPIEKYEFFEKKIRRRVQDSYAKYFPDSTEVLEEVLNLMFQTADNTFTETLKVDSKNVKIVPDATAKFLNAKSSLWDQVDNLVKEETETCKKYGAMPKAVFGTTFRSTHKMDSKADDFKSRWHGVSKHPTYHQELETFAAVWKNITHLQSTRKFCMWLANNPNVVPPAFLENQGLLRDNLSLNFSGTADSLFEECASPEEFVERSFRPSISKTVDAGSQNDSSSLSSHGSVDISDINIIV